MFHKSILFLKMAVIDWAPFSVPLQRRIQTLAVILIVHSFLFGHIFGCLLFAILLIIPVTTTFALLYLGWTYIINYNRPSRGGRLVQWCRKHKVWKYFCDFFPIDLIKTADLDPNENYIFGYHPHGIIGLGAIGNFCGDGTGFSSKFPGITPHLLTLAGNMSFPFTRDYFMSFGVCTVDKASIEYILQRMGKGQAAVIVVGGAAESLDAHPGNFRLTLKNRKGFAKIALRNGANLVPVYSFGENDLYTQVKNPSGSQLRQWQNKVKNIVGFAPPIFHGRGIFQYTFGILPHRRPVNTVVGAPIKVNKVDNPSEEQIISLHQQYLDGLEKVFEDHKITYGISQDVHLEFL